MSVMISVIIFFVVPEKRSEKSVESFQNQLSGVKHIFQSRRFWRTAPVTTMSHAAFLSIQGLWVGPWLRDVGGMGRPEIAALLSWIALAMVTGFVTLGLLAERLNSKGMDLLLISVMGMTVFTAIQGAVLLEVFQKSALIWILFGFFGTSGIIAYAGLSRQFPGRLSGRVTTGLNLLVFVSAFAAQWAIGAIINFFEGGAGSLDHYGASGYRAGFGLMIVLQLISIGLVLYCRGWKGFRGLIFNCGKGECTCKD